MEAQAHVAIITFNCAREPIDPHRFAANLVQTVNWPQLPDIIFLALQEVAPIAHSFLGGSFLNPYLAQFGHAIRIAAASWVENSHGEHGDLATPVTSEARPATDAVSTYVPIQVSNVGMTAAMLFVRDEAVQRVRWIETAGTGVGWWNMGNKGCVGIRIGYSTTSQTLVPLTFLAAHLAPGEPNRQRRNADWRHVVEEVVFSRRTGPVASRKTGRGRMDAGYGHSEETESLLQRDNGPSASSAIYGSLSPVFIAGDLNYRTSDMPPAPEDSIKFPIPQSLTDFESFRDLFGKDQLNSERQAQRTLHHFHEPPVRFPPTYKYAAAARQAASVSREAMYTTSKQPVWTEMRWPSWCDRILMLDELAPADGRSAIRPLNPEYRSLPLLATSDHQPVALYCELDLAIVLASHEAGRNSSLEAPYALNPEWQARRAAARRWEVVVGLAAYFGWTWEGNALVLATILGGWGGWTLLRMILEQS